MDGARRRLLAGTAAFLCLALALSSRLHAAQPADPQSYRQVLDRYCVTCHNDRAKTGGLSLAAKDLSNVAADAEVWEKVVRKVRARMMPPQGMPHPDEETRQALTAWLERSLDRAADAAPNPGRALIHRLNRTEYANAIRDLLALNVDAAALLPPDDAAYGFDNIADALGVSPVLLERYLSAAGKIAAIAVGDPQIKPASETFRVRQDRSQDVHIEGLPLGTFGGLVVRPTLPLDGDYRFQVKLYRTNTGVVRGLENQHHLELTIDGRRVVLAAFGGDEDFRASLENPTTAGDAVDGRFDVQVPLKGGPHVATAAFLAVTAPAPARLEPFVRSSADTLDPAGHPHVESLTITGPFNQTRSGDTPTRRRIFVCSPASKAAEEPCARRIISALARRAYRRPVTQSDLEPLLRFYQEARAARGFEAGIELALQRILTDPEFVFRVEHDPSGVRPGSVYHISDVELASRLSFFLWSSIPDDQLLREASLGRLKTPAVLTRQVQRMLADPRAAALVTDFAGQWLYLRNLRNQIPNSLSFPDFDDNLRLSFQRETELLFESVVREDRNVLDLLNANYTFVNERLARHYGMKNIYGSHFRRVPVVDEARRGLLGQGSILMVTSHADRTSPVVRGKWILENLLGVPPPAPPADVPPLKEDNQREGGRVPTMRERMEEHRANPVCAACHKIMDPIGFALENFDAVGKWRSHEAGGDGTAIDASGQLMDGTRIDGVVTLRAALLRQPDIFVGTMTEKLMTYALGRGLTYHDMPSVRRIVRESAGQGYRFSTLILGIVNSRPFQTRIAAEDTAVTHAGP